MKLHEKITHIRKEKGLKLQDLHRRLQEIFGDRALSYRTLQRIEKGQTDGRGSSLYQICLGLGITLKELREGTEDGFTLADLVRRSKRQGRYIYNEKSYAEILTGLGIRFIALELVLEAGGKTKIEKDPVDEGKFEKFVYVIKGKITCIIKEKRFILKRGDCLTFDSRLPHSFQNETSSQARCIVIQNPRHI